MTLRTVDPGSVPNGVEDRMSAPPAGSATKQRMADDAAQTIRAARRRLEELDTEQRQLQDLINTMERVQSAVGIRVDLRQQREPATSETGGSAG